MIKDLCDVLRDSMGDKKIITERAIIELIGIYGLTRLNDAGAIIEYESYNGVRTYSLKQ